jgi:hypothetical protein
MDPVEKQGIKELTEVIDFLFDVAEAVQMANEDGKITIGDAPKFLRGLMKAPAAIGGANVIPKEIADLTEEELKQITDRIKERFEIKDDKLEAYVENAIVSGASCALNISRIISLRKTA